MIGRKVETIPKLPRLRHRNWKRTLLVLLLFLGAGTIVNVAVAWGCALWSPQEMHSGRVPVAAPERWPRYLCDLGWPEPVEAVELQLLDGLGAKVIDAWGGDPSASYERSDAGLKMFASLETRQFGLPLRTLQWEMHGVRAGGRSMDVVKVAAAAAGHRTGIDVSEPTGAIKDGRMRCLPLTPLWPGFAINTIFYATILWMLFAFPFMLRRKRRMKRGLCPACAYPIGVSELCTECGRVVQPRIGIQKSLARPGS